MSFSGINGNSDINEINGINDSSRLNENNVFRSSFPYTELLKYAVEDFLAECLPG